MEVPYNRFNGAFILLLLVGYFFISFLPGIVGLESRVFTVPYRAVVLLVSIYVIVRGVQNTKHQTFPNWQWSLLILFWVFYVFRIIIDLYARGIHATVFPNHADYLMNALGICLIPAAAIRYTDRVDYQWVLKWLFRLLLVALVLSVIFNLSSTLDDSGDSSGRFRGSAGVNTISYGHYGVSFALLAFFLYSKTSSYFHKAIYIASFFFGLFIMYLAGSRSPLVALLICLFFYQITNKGAVRGVIALSILTIPLIVFSDVIIEFMSGFGGSFLERVMTTVEEGNTSGRDDLYTQAFHEFSESPWVGNAFLIQSGRGIGFYPHNIILEALMATGIVGGGILLGWIYKCLRVAYLLVTSSHPNAWTGVLFLQYLILGLFSLSIFSNALFWYYSIVVLNVAYSSIQQYREQNKEVLVHA